MHSKLNAHFYRLWEPAIAPVEPAQRPLQFNVDVEKLAKLAGVPRPVKGKPRLQLLKETCQELELTDDYNRFHAASIAAGAIPSS